MITTAVLLAAGKGTRLGPLAAENPKPLLRIGVEPVIDRIIDSLRDCGVTDVVVVTGHLAEQIEMHVGARFGDLVTFARQGDPHGTAHALLQAAPHIDRSQPFFLGWGDIVTAPEDYRAVIAAWRDDADAVVGVNWMPDPSQGAAVVVSDDTVVAIVEKPPADDVPSHWNNSGLLVLGPAIWDFVGALGVSERGELELPDALAALIASGGTVVAAEVQGPWFDIGTPESLAAAREVYG